jgi:hypothetical protein
MICTRMVILISAAVVNNSVIYDIDTAACGVLPRSRVRRIFPKLTAAVIIGSFLRKDVFGILAKRMDHKRDICP